MLTLSNFDDLEKVDLTGIKLTMWDMDGTIVKTEHLHCQAIYNLLSEKIHSPIEIEKEMQGLSDQDVFNSYAKYLDFESLSDFINAKNSILKELLDKHKHSIISSKIIKYLSFLKEQNIVCALVTSSQREVMLHILKVLNLEKYFDFIRCFEDNLENKPHPAPYLNTLRESNTESHFAIIFEDSQTGLKAAKAANVKSVYQVKWY